MQRQSQEAFALLADSEEIVSSIETHGVEVAARLEEKWTAMAAPTDPDAPQLVAASPPDYLGNLLSLRDGLSASSTTLGRADQTHVHQLAKVLELRGERDTLFADASRIFSTTRRTIDDIHGEGQSFVLAGMESPTARTPKKILRQLDLAVSYLRQPNPKLTIVKVEGVTIDTVAMVGKLEQVAEALRAKQNEFQRARRAAQASRKEKQRRIVEHRDHNSWTARIVEGYYRLAGETELAERLRSVAARPGRRPVPAPAPDDEGPTPDETPPTDAPAPDEPEPDEPEPDEGTGETLTAALRANPRPAPSATPA